VYAPPAKGAERVGPRRHPEGTRTELTFLGTSAGVPTRERGLSAVALRLDEGALWLFDCGEGTQQRLLAFGTRAARIGRVLLTHLHGDHCFGLPGLLASLGLWGRTDPVEVVGPRGLRAWLEATFRASELRLGFPLAIRELDEAGGVLPEQDGLTVEARPLVHRVPSFAYVVREPARRGHLDPARARALGVPDGPLLGRLARGEAVTLSDGRRVEPRGVLGAERPGRVLVLCGDSGDSSALLTLEPGCDVLVHECTYDGARGEQARRWGHSTTADVAALARALRPRQLVATHLSARYTVEGAALDADALGREIERGCPGQSVQVAFDGLTLDVPAREP
jgi:ribonuclease Z